MNKNIEELTMLLLYLTSWEEKGYVYIDDELKEENLQTVGKNILLMH